MNFYYDPILGLQYNYLGETILLDIDALPQDFKFDAEQWMKYVSQMGVMWMDSSPSIQIVPNITDYML